MERQRPWCHGAAWDLDYIAGQGQDYDGYWYYCNGGRHNRDGGGLTDDHEQCVLSGI